MSMSDSVKLTGWLTPAEAEEQYPGYARGEALVAETPEQLDSFIEDRLGFCDLRAIDIVSIIRVRNERAEHGRYRAYLYIYDADTGHYTFL